MSATKCMTALLCGALALPLAAGGASMAGTSSEPLVPPPDREQVAVLAELALSCIERPYPYKPGHVLPDKETLREPRVVHPVFYGCFDWHSAVHGHWTLVRLLRLYPDHPLAARIRAALDRQLDAKAFRTEAAYFDEEHTRSFERPYGWAWLLQLAAELERFADDPDGARWRRAIRPLEQAIVARYQDYLPKLSWPIRTGVHPNTAFALALAHDYARLVGNERLEQLVASRARDYYGQDEDCPVAYEPSGEDFFSPCLLEADLMRRILDEKAFRGWVDAFLPGLRKGQLGGLAEPVTVSDPSDPKIVHLDGLNLVRAWTLAGIASALEASGAGRTAAERAARAHTAAGLARVASGHYEGEHWLASFATYLTTGAWSTAAETAARDTGADDEPPEGSDHATGGDSPPRRTDG